jgi:hypothetical protein
MSQLDKITISGKIWYSLGSRFITVAGQDWEVFGGTSTGKTAHEVDYDLRNIKTGELKVKPFISIMKHILHEEKHNQSVNI